MLKLWDLKGNLLNTFKNHTDQINASSFSEDGKLLASASDDKTVKIWKSDGTLLNTLSHEKKVNSVSFSLDSKFIISGSDDKTAKFWQQNGILLKTLSHEDKVNSVAISSSGKLIASASDDKKVKIWRHDGKLMNTLSHDDKVKTVKFSPDSKFIASASEDGIVKLWTSDGKEITVIKGTSRLQPNIQFSPDSKMLGIKAGQSSNFNLHMVDGVWVKDWFLAQSYSFSDFLFYPDAKLIATASENEIKYLDLTLDRLIEHGCSWLRDYLTNNPNIDKDDRKLCDDIPTQK